MLLGAYILPHPPLLVPEIGKGREKEIQDTIDACNKVADDIKSKQPDLIVIISPHAPSYSNYLFISGGPQGVGTFSRFGCPEVGYDVRYDEDFQKVIDKKLQATSMTTSAGFQGDNAHELDHGTMVPLHFILNKCSDFKVVRLSVSGLPFEEHEKFGTVINDAIMEYGKKTVVVASGDLSHALSHDAPCGYAPEGKIFDEQVVNIIKTGTYHELKNIDRTLATKAKYCGLPSFIIMNGIIKAHRYTSHLLAYEGPFGVGYPSAMIAIES